MAKKVASSDIKSSYDSVFQSRCATHMHACLHVSPLERLHAHARASAFMHTHGVWRRARAHAIAALHSRAWLGRMQSNVKTATVDLEQYQNSYS